MKLECLDGVALPDAGYAYTAHWQKDRSDGPPETIVPMNRLLLARVNLCESDATRREIVCQNEGQTSVGHAVVTGAGVYEELARVQKGLLIDWLSSMGLGEKEDYDVQEPTIVAGGGTDFHVDEEFGQPGVVFCITSLLGKGDFVMGNGRWRKRFDIGTTIAFDPMNVHGLSEEGGWVSGGVPFLIHATTAVIFLQGCRKLGTVASGNRAERGALFDRFRLDAVLGGYDTGAPLF